MFLNTSTIYSSDIEEIISHRYDNGGDLWATPDNRLLKGAPYTTLESVLYLLEVGLPTNNSIMKDTVELIFSTWQKDGRFRIFPKGAIYPCQTALALKVLCYLGFSSDSRCQKSFQYFAETQQEDGGWKCNKYSFGHGEETNYSTPYTTMVVLDALRFTDLSVTKIDISKAVDFLLQHWVIRKPISPCHYGIGSLFMQVGYPFRDYNLFYYLFVLSFYKQVKDDTRFLDALNALKAKTVDDKIIVERVVPKLAKLSFCRKGQVSELATKRFNEILQNIENM